MREGAGRARILVTGATGQVGGAAVLALAPIGEVIAPDRAEMDLADAASVRRAMRDLKPRWVVNAGAYTAVDRAETEAELAWTINAMAPGVLGEEAQRIGAAVVHFSTDYVFDGSKQLPYVETDATAPLNVYGRSKLEGERGLAASGAAHLIFRTSWVYGATGKNFLRSVLRMAREREVLRIVADQHGAPTWSEELGRMTAHAIAQLEARAAKDGGRQTDTVRAASGVYHAAGAGETTWLGFARAILEEAQQFEPERKPAKVEAISMLEHPMRARRPANSRLDCAKLERVFGWRMAEWQESMRRALAQLRAMEGPISGAERGAAAY